MKNRRVQNISIEYNENDIKQHRTLFAVSASMLTVYILWRAFFTLPFEYGIIALVFGILMLIAEFMGFFETFVNHRHLSNYMVPERPQIPANVYPHVDIFVATHNEDVDLLFKTLNACTYIDYPDKNKVHIYLCDDNNRPEMEELARDLGVGYFGMVGNEEAKAGNLNNGMRQTSSPLVVTLDADMIPHNDFLMETVPYFFLPTYEKNDEGAWVKKEEADIDPEFRIGFIQTPQAFYNPDLFQYYLYSEDAVPNEQDYFFKEVNVAHNYDNGSIYAGSNTVLLREALEKIGYIGTGSVTEDYLTGIRIQKEGYRNFGINKVVAHGLSPTKTSALLSQRERWGRGTIQCLRMEKAITTKKLTFWQKVTLMSGYFYWLNFVGRIILLLAPMSTVLFNMRVVDSTTWQVLIFWLPAYLLYNKSVRVLSGNKRSHHWNSLVSTIMAPYIAGPIIKEMLGLKIKKFVVTDKGRSKRNKKLNTFLFSLPYLIMFTMGVLAIMVMVAESINTRSLYNPIVLYWVILSTKDLMFALFFVYGRTNIRMADRFYVKVPTILKYKGKEYKGTTSDLSETGLAIIFTQPVYFPIDTKVEVIIKTDRYSSTFNCIVTSVLQVGDDWKYGLKIEDMSEEDKKQYYQIVYDRKHTLPDTMSPYSSVFGDLNTNFINRSKRKKYNYRKLPRLTLNLAFKTADGHSGNISDYNFEYASLNTDIHLRDDEYLTIDFGDDMIMKLKPATGIRPGTETLFQVINKDEIVENPDFGKILESWMNLEKVHDREVVNGKATIKSAV